MNEDAIDRKLVCAFITGLISDDGEREKGLEYIRSMPAVNPTKTGHWIRQDNTKEPLYGWYFCSECNSVIGDKTKFCSNCGCRMVEPQERSGEE